MELAELTHMPVDMTLMGLGAFPGEHPQSMGMLGMHGTYWANMAMHYSDLVVAIGGRFDDRVTGKVSEFCPYAKVIHIDIDPTSIRKNVHVDIPIVGDCRTVFRELIQILRATANGDQREFASPGGTKSANGNRRTRSDINRNRKDRSTATCYRAAL